MPRPAPLDRDTVCIFLVVTRLSRWVDRDAVLPAQAAPTTDVFASRARLRFSRAPPNQQQLTRRDLVSSTTAVRCRLLRLRMLWSSARNCGVSLLSATSQKPSRIDQRHWIDDGVMSLAFYHRDVACHRCPAPYFEKQQPRFPKGDLVSNPPSLAGV